MNRLFVVLLLITPFVLCGQSRAIPVNVSLFNESTAIPFTRFFTTPIHPGIQIGTEFNYKEKKHRRLFQSVNLSYFYHNYLAQGIGLNTEFGYEYRLKSGIAFEGRLGVGYMHTFATAEEYRFVNGHYEKKADNGNARLYPSFTLNLGYYIKKSDKLSPKIFLAYQSWAEYPYSPGFIPVMTHINLYIGAKFHIQRNTGNNDK